MVNRDIELRKELSSLQDELRSLDFIKNFSCETEEEFALFKQKNIVQFNRLKVIQTRINEIEWELMTDEDKINYIKHINDLKDKFS